MHEDKRHSYQEGDHVKFVEVEGMTEINSKNTFEITRVMGPYSFKIKADSRQWGAYKRQGIVENIKVPKSESFHSLAESVKNPTASSRYGMLETPDLRFFGRSEQLHQAIRATHQFHEENKRYPALADAEAVLAIAKTLNAVQDAHRVEELEDRIVTQTASFAACAVCP